MLSSQDFHPASRSRDQSGTTGYVPNGLPDLQLANQYSQYTQYGLAPQNHNMVAMHNFGVGGGNGTINSHHWGHQPQPHPRNTFTSSSNNRDQRNRAEKMRRDKLNSLITEMSTLIPMVQQSPKRLDKTSILRITAATLRLHHTISKSTLPEVGLPNYVDQFMLEQLICEEMSGFLLIVNTSGKIIFVSHTVENLLGHLQTDLMGQLLFSITDPEDHKTLQLYLRSEGELEKLWKLDFCIHLKRAGPKSEAPQYESVRMLGTSRNFSTPSAAVSPSSADDNRSLSPSSSTAMMQNTLNTQVIVFFVRINRPHPLVDRLVATSRDEYITRHLIDGRIVACDHRISLIAGYMTDEVTGKSGFNFMHKEDVRFAMIALRHMYDKGESRGSSCYRLQSSNGQFIYLRTFGFLEVDAKGIVESFMCVNVLMDNDEGEYYIEDMKKRFAAFFNSSLAKLPYEDKADLPKSTATQQNAIPQAPTIPDGTEDPKTLEIAINELMQNLPLPEDEQGCNIFEETSFANSNADYVPNGMTSTPQHPQGTMTGSKRSLTSSPETIKRQRLDSVNSDPPELSPAITSPECLFHNGSPDPSLLKMPKLEEQYSVLDTDFLLPEHQRGT